MHKACLLIHGLTGTPATLDVVKNSLLAAGFRVSAPCLAGHGGSVEDLELTSWRQWYETVRVAYQELRRDMEKVYCVGISLGALLTMKLALDEGWGVKALALLSTPMRLPLFNRMLLPIFKNTPIKNIIRKVSKDFRASVADEGGRELYKQYSLPCIPTKSVIELSELERHLTDNKGKIFNPMLLIHAKNDRVSPLYNVDLVRAMVSSEIVETEILSRSKHVISMDFEKDAVASRILSFFNKFV